MDTGEHEDEMEAREHEIMHLIDRHSGGGGGRWRSCLTVSPPLEVQG